MNENQFFLVIQAKQPNRFQFLLFNVSAKILNNLPKKLLANQNDLSLFEVESKGFNLEAYLTKYQLENFINVPIKNLSKGTIQKLLLCPLEFTLPKAEIYLLDEQLFLFNYWFFYQKKIDNIF